MELVQLLSGSPKDSRVVRERCERFTKSYGEGSSRLEETQYLQHFCVQGHVLVLVGITATISLADHTVEKAIVTS